MAVQFAKFEDMKIWQESATLATDIYAFFKDNRDYGFKDQIQRAAVSIMNNIAEGYERGSKKSFTSYLLIAKGSCGEVRSMLYLAGKLGYLSESESEQLMKRAMDLSKMIYGFIRSLNKQEN